MFLYLRCSVLSRLLQRKNRGALEDIGELLPRR